MNASGERSRSSTSTLCCWYKPSAQCRCFFTEPSVGLSSPLMSLRSVDLPATRGNQRQSASISVHQHPSAVISVHQRSSAAIRGHQHVISMQSARSVDLPQPLGPTSATRESQSTPRLSFSYKNSSGLPEYEKETSSKGSTGGARREHSGNCEARATSQKGWSACNQHAIDGQLRKAIRGPSESTLRPMRGAIRELSEANERRHQRALRGQ